MRFLISTVMATVLLLLVLAGIAFAKEPEASSTSAAHSTTWATSAVTPTISYMPATITDLGTYPFTYTIRLHNPISSPLTTTVRVTVTLDPYLDFDPESGTLLLPDEGTLMFPGSNQVVWEPTLEFCNPVTLTVNAEGTFDEGTLNMGLGAVTTRVEWDGSYEDLVTRLRIYKIYMPIIMRNF